MIHLKARPVKQAAWNETPKNYNCKNYAHEVKPYKFFKLRYGLNSPLGSLLQNFSNESGARAIIMPAI